MYHAIIMLETNISANAIRTRKCYVRRDNNKHSWFNHKHSVARLIVIDENFLFIYIFYWKHENINDVEIALWIFRELPISHFKGRDSGFW